MFTNPYFIAVGIPFFLLLCGAFAKKLVRGSSWQRKDFYLGVEFTLAAMSSALVYIFDLIKLHATPGIIDTAATMNKIAATATFIASAFFLLLLVLSIHQDWEGRIDRPHAQLLRLGGLANLVGAGLLAIFILVVKGV